jgi:hypothetical protein
MWSFSSILPLKKTTKGVCGAGGVSGKHGDSSVLYISKGAVSIFILKQPLRI